MMTDLFKSIVAELYTPNRQDDRFNGFLKWASAEKLHAKASPTVKVVKVAPKHWPLLLDAVNRSQPPGVITPAEVWRKLSIWEVYTFSTAAHYGSSSNWPPRRLRTRAERAKWLKRLCPTAPAGAVKAMLQFDAVYFARTARNGRLISTWPGTAEMLGIPANWGRLLSLWHNRPNLDYSRVFDWDTEYRVARRRPKVKRFKKSAP